MAKQLSGSELRKFRSDVTTLKRAGLIPGKAINARSARPFQKRGRKTLRELVRKHSKTIKEIRAGTGQVVSLPPAAVREQHQLGRKSVARGKVLVHKSPNEHIEVSKSGAVKIIHTESGITRIELPGKFLDKRSIERVRAVGDEVTKSGGKVFWGYEFYGHKSGKAYDSLEAMLRDLRFRYEGKIRKDDIKSTEFYDRISILVSKNWGKLAPEKGKPSKAAKKGTNK